MSFSAACISFDANPLTKHLTSPVILCAICMACLIPPASRRALSAYPIVQRGH